MWLVDPYTCLEECHRFDRDVGPIETNQPSSCSVFIQVRSSGVWMTYSKLPTINMPFPKRSKNKFSILQPLSPIDLCSRATFDESRCLSGIIVDF